MQNTSLPLVETFFIVTVLPLLILVAIATVRVVIKGITHDEAQQAFQMLLNSLRGFDHNFFNIFCLLPPSLAICLINLNCVMSIHIFNKRSQCKLLDVI